MDLSKRILYYCDALGISINNLADRSGINQSTLFNIVSGKSSTAQLDTIESICDGIGISLIDFFHEDDSFPLPALQELRQFKDYLRWKYEMTDKK